jgi:Mechanosensitive ion channel
MLSSRFKLAWDDSVSAFAEALPWQLIAFTIAVGALLSMWIIFNLGDCCLASKTADYRKRKRRCGRSAGRFAITMLAILVGAIGLWIACTTAGVSFWNILFGYGIAALIMTYSFGVGLQSLGAYIIISGTNKMYEEQYVEMTAIGVEGFVKSINIFWVDILTSKGKLRQIPTVLFLSQIVDQDDDKESEEKQRAVASSIDPYYGGGRRGLKM